MPVHVLPLSSDGDDEATLMEEGLALLQTILQWMGEHPAEVRQGQVMISLLASSFVLLRLAKTARLAAAHKAGSRVGFERSGLAITHEMLAANDGTAASDAVNYLSAFQNCLLSFHVSPDTYPLLEEHYSSFCHMLADFANSQRGLIPTEARTVLSSIASDLSEAGLGDLSGLLAGVVEG